MNAWELNRMTCDTLVCIGFALLWVLKVAAVAAVLLSPFALEWLLDGCPSQQEQVERLIEDVKYGWR